MAQDWRNDEPRIRMRKEAAPTPKPGKSATPYLVFIAALIAGVVGIICYTIGESMGAANVASVTQPTTLEDLREKYGDQDWAMRFDDEHVVAMWDEPRKLMSYLHLTCDDYAALCGERNNWTRKDRFSAMVSAAIRRRDAHTLSISNPPK